MLAPKGCKHGSSRNVPWSILQFQLLFVTLFVLLELHVLANHLLVQAHRVHAVPWCPEMVAPIGLPFQVRKLLNTRIAERPSKMSIMSEVDFFGGTITTKCTWSG